MKRLIDHYLLQWKTSLLRKPLLLRGARQVGKTYAVRVLGETYASFVEINFEDNKKARTVFQADLDPARMLRELAIHADQQIIPGQTLLFLDEVQIVPEALLALRYFYEKMPDLHVIAAGSLLDFAIEKVGVPVGRVQFLYMHPVSFIEFLAAMGQENLLELIVNNPRDKAVSDGVHNRALMLLGQFLALGGMPQVVSSWQQFQDLQACSLIPRNLIMAYQFDFIKYGKSHQIKYLDALISHIPQQLGKKFKYSLVGEYRKRELEPCVDLLVTAGLMHRVVHTGAQGIPLGAQIDLNTFKLLLLDVGLIQFLLGIKTGDWLLNPLETFINRGLLAEAFVGQELVAYEHATHKPALYYWKRDAHGSEAEVDYVVQLSAAAIPVEVKSGKGSSIKSMRLFLDSHSDSPYGIRFSTHNYSIFENIHSYPLYAVASMIAGADEDSKAAMLSLLAT